MSYYHDAVTWQNADGSWNRGYFKRISMESQYNESYDEDDDGGYNPEIHDQYSDEFEYVTFGHSTPDHAREASPYANTGESSSIIREERNLDTINKLDEIADLARVESRKDSKIKIDEKHNRANPNTVASDNLRILEEFAKNKDSDFSDFKMYSEEILNSIRLAANHPDIKDHQRESFKARRAEISKNLTKNKSAYAKQIKDSYSPKMVQKEFDKFTEDFKKTTINAARTKENIAFENSNNRTKGPKYHVNPETGRAGQCRAKKSCPFGGESSHYANASIARKAYEYAQPSSFKKISKKK